MQIAGVPRHESLQSTALYVRLDLDQLRRAASWPHRRAGRDENTTSAMNGHVADYLRLRPALGFNLGAWRPSGFAAARQAGSSPDQAARGPDALTVATRGTMGP